MREIIYADNEIIIEKREVFGKIGLAGTNKKQKTTVTAFASSEKEIPVKVGRMINELKKPSHYINLTPRLHKIEENYLKYLKSRT
jgi:hypothetical protein